MGVVDGGLWLGRYERPLPIRARGSFHILRARLPSGVVRTVVTPGPRADLVRAADALAEIERVHELAFDAVADGTELVRLLADTNQKIDYPQADALIVEMRETLQAAHAVTDPETGEPPCIGRLTYGNLLLARDGRIAVIGFGHNV